MYSSLYRIGLIKIPAVLLTGILGATLALTGVAYSQQQEQKPQGNPRERTPADRKYGNEPPPKVITEEDRQALRREESSEAEAAILPYINNFFSTIRLGPEDVLTIDVFDQPMYSRSNITVPPNGKINYPLIGQIMIAGRTVEEVEKDFAKKLAEYIIEPKVTVQIVTVHSLKYMVIGDVTSPGIFEMSRRMSLTEGLAKAGYVTKYGDRKNISVLRMQPNGQPMPIKVNMNEVEKGRAQDIFLTPGDTVVVPGNLLKKVDSVVGLVALVAWMRVIAQ